MSDSIRFGGTFDYENKQQRLMEIMRELEDPTLWANQERAQNLGKERVQLENVVTLIQDLETKISDTTELLALAEAEKDETLLRSLTNDVEKITDKIVGLEFRRMFSNPMDPNNAYVDIQSGSGGTEAQDWAEMLLRMYLRWGDQHQFKTELIHVSPGEVAGIKSAAIRFDGEYAYGWLRTETGVHRLVRKSPFDSGNRRHTSFASVFVSPEIDDDFDIEINPADLRIDTYRARGAGGQHVNTTDSAIRITHNPTGIVVQCQTDRSQHKNRAQAFKQLRSKLYELELHKKTAEKRTLEEGKSDITWGSQIRSYILDDLRIKDLRTGVETTSPQKIQAILDGDLDMFMEASLKEGV
jgi:peptide chain release factor 2